MQLIKNGFCLSVLYMVFAAQLLADNTENILSIVLFHNNAVVDKLTVVSVTPAQAQELAEASPDRVFKEVEFVHDAEFGVRSRLYVLEDFADERKLSFDIIFKVELMDEDRVNRKAEFVESVFVANVRYKGENSTIMVKSISLEQAQELIALSNDESLKSIEIVHGVRFSVEDNMYIIDNPAELKKIGVRMQINGRYKK